MNAEDASVYMALNDRLRVAIYDDPRMHITAYVSQGKNRVQLTNIFRTHHARVRPGLDDLFTEIMRVAQDAGETTKKPRPWDCCDRSICTALIPPKCRCLDKVDQCSNACNKCEETEDSSRYTCADVYNDVPGPVCTQGHETRPWKCCNKQICTKSFPPICTCKDLFDKPCEEACKRCMVLGGPHKRYQCLDSYFGHMAPRCGLHGGMQ
ncbi:hypothetical protein PR202_gb26569 [Eleusine coracana subsp. coracana]|uniref:Bowman-Birk serine protease inhibitors family domain-containing protein n=1 Tax=Eleusine coracana subsp. coracana TaxID=191504 RepID=A0AAV5FS78_ELECO|nr:hypothetical protein PR202_gb26569 [Eleusine coracana subsp. coracana]